LLINHARASKYHDGDALSATQEEWVRVVVDIPRSSLETTMVKTLLALSCLINAASAFSAMAPASKSSSKVFDNLRSTPLIRASDSSPIILPDQWRSSTPFGLGDETAVLAFLRHYG